MEDDHLGYPHRKPPSKPLLASGFVELPLKNGDFPMFSLYVYQRENSMGVFRNAVAFWPWPGLKKIHHQSLI